MQNLEEYLKDNYCHVLILDEIMAAIHGDLVRVEQVCRIIDQKPKGMELVLTGRNVPDEIAERADLITEMRRSNTIWTKEYLRGQALNIEHMLFRHIS